MPHIDWETDAVTSKCQNRSLHNQLLDIANSNSLSQTVNKITRGENTLDLFFTNNESLVNRVETIPGMSDHDIVLIENELSPKRVPQPKRKVLLYKKGDYDGMKDELKSFQQEFNTIDKDSITTSEPWSLFKTKMEQLISKYVPTKMWSKKHKLPYFNQELSKLNKIMHKAYAKGRRNSKANHRYKRIKSVFQRKLRQAYWDYMQDIFAFNDTCCKTNDNEPTTKTSKRFWSFFKNQRQENSGVAPLRENGKLVSHTNKKAEILNKQFSSVFTSETTPPHSFEESPYPSMPKINVSINGVTKLLKNLNPNKAQGPDGLHSRLLKLLADEIAPILSVIFQHSINTGDVPIDWRQGNIAPIYKKGDKHKASNYRPVSLTSICSKLIEHIIVSNLRDHLDKHNILANEQHGFRAKRSCESQLLTFTHELFNNVSGGGQVDAVVLDFSKAFDKVPHDRLMAKLDHYG